MKVLHTLLECRQKITQLRKQDKRIAFVPTMGNLHEGHLELVRAAKTQADVVVVSIFVNPLQFGPNEDFDRYPRTLASDCSALESLGEGAVDIVFAPNVMEMYPEGFPIQTQVSVPTLATHWCGASRPHFFGGVATVVTKLFNIVMPDVACFGEKDFQQLCIIKTVVKDLSFPIEIVGVPIVRASDGLALSSRNQYLSKEERSQAPLLYQTLQHLQRQLSQTIETNDPAVLSTLITAGKQALVDAGFTVDYLGITNTSDLVPATTLIKGQRYVLLAAVLLGKTRLIDNVSFDIF